MLNEYGDRAVITRVLFLECYLMRDIAIEEPEATAGCVPLPGRGCTGKIRGLHTVGAKCPGRYSVEELFWLNATVFFLQVSL